MNIMKYVLFFGLTLNSVLYSMKPQEGYFPPEPKEGETLEQYLEGLPKEGLD